MARESDDVTAVLRTSAPTYKDIARITGLSLATISKHFNGGSVREPNRVAIEDAVDRLGYRVNEAARSLRTRRSRAVGVYLPELGGDFHFAVIAGVESALREDGAGVIVSSGGTGPDGEHPLDALLSRQVDAVIAVPGPQDGAALARVVATGTPLVLVDRLVDGVDVDAVVLDNQRAAVQAVQHLLDLGHTRVGLVCGPREVWTMRERLMGYRAALGAAHLPTDDRDIEAVPLTVEDGRSAARRILDRPDRPSAIVCVNERLVLGALVAARELGFSVPQDLSVVGFDGPEVALAMNPPLTVVVQPTATIAERAARLLHARFVDPTATTRPQIFVMPSTLVPGGSTGVPKPDREKIPRVQHPI
ncbi:LacI family DNA-binding transcriptional regulator [Kineococcus gynurae]|uniref:LacI family DNA-binding transcriptional regulator n=1 Tax=Kineococcus gynurae TaxID=452979 RepID=A0ABV5LST5_9ACTN